jgi:hypothetical protein
MRITTNILALNALSVRVKTMIFNIVIYFTINLINSRSSNDTTYTIMYRIEIYRIKEKIIHSNFQMSLPSPKQ